MANYKITKKLSHGEDHETNPIEYGGVEFVKVGYTDNEKVADWYRNDVLIISVEEVADQE